MNWNLVMGLVSTVALSLPIITIIIMGLYNYRSFPFLLFYYAVVMVYNLLTEGYIDAPESFIHYYGILNNLFDAPLMLVFLTYFSPSIQLKKRMKWLAIIFMVFEAVIIGIYGFTLKAITIVMGPGIMLVLAFTLPFFVRQSKITITNHKATGKAMMTAALLFAYGCYSIIYIMYYLMDFHDVQNTFLVYFFVSSFSSVLICAGIIIEKKRIRKLSELMVVRRELSELYKQDKKTGPYRPALFDYDKDGWS